MSVSEAVYGPLITSVLALFFGWLLVRGFQTGTAEFHHFGPAFSGDRAEQPVRFWLVTALLGFLAACGAFATVGQLFLPHGL